MRSILEKALTYLLNEEHEKAEELFHQFIIERARQIHESLRQGEDKILDENWDQEIGEDYFGEDDLADVDSQAADATMPGEDGDVGDDMAGPEMGGDETDPMTGGMGDDVGQQGDGSLEQRVAELEDELEQMMQQFQQITGTDDAMGDETDPTMAGDMDADADGMAGGEHGDAAAMGAMDGNIGGGGMGGPEEMEDESYDPMSDPSMPGDPMMDDMEMDDPTMMHMESDSGDGDDDNEELEEDDYDELSEAIVDELETVSATLTDGHEVGRGRKFTQNNHSPTLQKPVGQRVGAKPVEIKSDEIDGYARESAPNVKDVKFYSKVRNTKKRGEEGQHAMTKQGNKNALINDLSSEDGNQRSPIGSRGSVGNNNGIR